MRAKAAQNLSQHAFEVNQKFKELSEKSVFE
jgi:hypothetical protein